ncbi:MAG: UDP-3-O-(3-hydroxymyristoyl)glucosamine N-acyltransferase [Sedimenticola sp.]|nr:UDP-3-O-(3-hydroxymyristoyl)glucosamine N-acyltransferase [Sedimenticola sp.]
MAFSLAELAQRVGADLRGNGAVTITHADTIQDGGDGAICFLANSKYRHYLATTRASAVILPAQDAAECPTNALVSDNPYLTYARIATLLYPPLKVVGGLHPSAILDESAVVHPESWVGPNSVIGPGVEIGAGSYIGPGCVVEAGSRIGRQVRLVANVTICHGSLIGDRVLIHPGAVIGSDGFGNANDQGAWFKVPQIGIARIGDDVEIGANTTIDRGSLRDTIISRGVRLDNQIQIAHNVKVGEHTAMAGCSGVAGSTTIGSHCTVGGGVGISGHLEIGDNVHFSGQTLVTRSFPEPGYYSGNLPAVPNGEWRKTVARIRRLEGMARRLNELEKQVFEQQEKKDPDGQG